MFSASSIIFLHLNLCFLVYAALVFHESFPPVYKPYPFSLKKLVYYIDIINELHHIYMANLEN